jgi:AmiR/NasT family two-component response regulator
MAGGEQLLAQGGATSMLDVRQADTSLSRRARSISAPTRNCLEMRKLVERAKGILQRDLGLSEEDAYRLLQRQSRQMRKSMREVAEAVVISDELKRTQQS